jgi:hypothetical protein
MVSLKLNIRFLNANGFIAFKKKIVLENFINNINEQIKC